MSITIADLPQNTNSLNSPIPITSANGVASSASTNIFTSALSLAGNAIKTLAINSGSGGSSDMSKALSAGTGIVSGAIAGSAFGPIGTAIGGLVGGIAGFFGMGKDIAAIKQENYNRDIGENVGHAKRFFDELISGSTNDYYKKTLALYRTELTAEEVAQIREVEIANVSNNAYYGGLGVQYTSAAGEIIGTVPLVGIAQDIEKYIAARNAEIAKQQAASAAQQVAAPAQSALDTGVNNQTFAINTLNDLTKALNQGRVLESNVAQASNSGGISLLNSKTITNAAMIIALGILGYTIFKKKG